MLPIRPSITDTIHTQRRSNPIVFLQPVPAAHPLLEYCFRSIVPPVFPQAFSHPPRPRFVNALSCSVTLLSHLLATSSLTVHLVSSYFVRVILL